MEETKKTPQYNLVGAILFSIAALFGIISVTSRLMHVFAVLYTIQSVIYIGGCIVLAVSLFQKRGDTLTLIGFALLALSALISLIGGFTGVAIGFLPNLLRLAGYLGALVVAAAHFTNYLDQYKDKIKKLWFVPAACIAAQIVVSFFIWIISMIIGGVIYRVGFWSTLVCAVAILFSCMWIVFPEGMPKKQINFGDGNINLNGGYAQTEIISEQDGYFELAVHVLLLLFTFGIWYYIWIYRMTKYLNILTDEPPRNPVTKLLLCMFIPFYLIYWVYKSAQRVDRLAASKGVPSDLSTLCLILAIFVGILPPILIQDKINTIIKANTNTIPQQPTGTTQSQSQQTNVDIPEELKKYKELLDSGVITQEEFDAKKHQLLNL